LEAWSSKGVFNLKLRGQERGEKKGHKGVKMGRRAYQAWSMARENLVWRPGVIRKGCGGNCARFVVFLGEWEGDKGAHS